MTSTTPYVGPMGAKLLAFDEIPTIDISPLFSGDAERFKATAKAIGQACETVGFFYITGHGVPEGLIARTYALSKRFHASSPEQKQSVHVRNSQGIRGWVPVSDEDNDGDPEVYRLFENQDDDFLGKPRLHAAFDSALEIPDDDPDFVAGNVLITPNQWPDWIPGFREGVQTYYQTLMGLGRTLFEAFAVALDLPADFFLSRISKAPSQLRLLHYPANDLPMNNDNLGIGAHSDFECFTILHQLAPGLQVMNVADEWVAAPPIAGSFIVNIGDLLEGWTNGRFKATQHRVVNTGKERYSMPLFFSVDYHTVVEPLPEFVSDENPAHYGRIVAGDHFAGFEIQLRKHLRRKVVTGELKVDFPIHKESPFKRKAVNEYEAQAEPAD